MVERWSADWGGWLLRRAAPVTACSTAPVAPREAGRRTPVRSSGSWAGALHPRSPGTRCAGRGGRRAELLRDGPHDVDAGRTGTHV